MLLLKVTDHRWRLTTHNDEQGKKNEMIREVYYIPFILSIFIRFFSNKMRHS